MRDRRAVSARRSARRAGRRVIAAAGLVLIALLAATALAQAPFGPAQPSQPQGPAQPAQPQGPPTSATVLNPALVRTGPTADEAVHRPVVLHLPGEAEAVIRRDLVYRTAGGRSLHFDLYLPPSTPKPPAAIVFSGGASDVRAWNVYTGYARLAAASGFAGILYEKHGERSELIQGVEDTATLLDHLRDHGRELGIDPARIVLWGFSGGGNVLGLGIDARRPEVRALIGFYPALDLSNLLPMFPDSLRAVAKRTISPADILESRPMALPPTLIARAGLDDPLLNSGILRFLRLALEAGRPIELINVAHGRHGFDLLDDTEESRRAIRRAFEFAREQTAP